jgi:catechol 2,3-dioxygenase-like lactoylglutathione lyase family enzyme
LLTNAKVVATVAATDMEAARAFYSNALGLPEFMATEEGLGYVLPDGSALQVYRRDGHRPPENTSVTFIVDDFDAEVADLRRRGITFEEYDLPGIKTVDGIATGADGMKAAWFKDPAGNILALGTMPQP